MLPSHAFILYLYNHSLINHTYSITLKKYSSHHPNDYSTYNIHPSINQTQSHTTYPNITILIIHSLDITHHFYPDIIHIHSYLLFRLYTQKLNTHSCYKKYWGLINYVTHSVWCTLFIQKNIQKIIWKSLFKFNHIFRGNCF